MYKTIVENIGTCSGVMGNESKKSIKTKSYGDEFLEIVLQKYNHGQNQKHRYQKANGN